MNTFAGRLRRATMVEHRKAETRGFITRLIAGDVPREGFAALTAQYLFIYRELEAAAERMITDKSAAPFADPALSRVAALEADLTHLLGHDAVASLAPIEATAQYTRRLRAHSHTSSAHFIAHHYVRYLGDLSGGLTVGRSVAATYGLGSAGTAFYSFDRIEDPAAYKTAYRAKLDALSLTGVELDTLVDEALLAFRLNAAVFDELGAAYPGERAKVG